MSSSSARSSGLALFLVLLAAAVVSYPCLRWGLPPGHDTSIHVQYLHYLNQQLRSGEVYPRWISGLNQGAGSPIFFIQYPLPYRAASWLQQVFQLPDGQAGEAHALGLFLSCCALLSGVSTWLWCRTRVGPLPALAASIVCLTAPYLLTFNLYVRAAIGEYCALAFVPLALACAHQLQERPRLAVAGMAATIAAILFSHLFTAVIFVPFLLLYAIACAPPGRMLEALVRAAAAVALGASLAAVYALPMALHRADFSLAGLTRRASGNYLYENQLIPFDRSLFPSSTRRWRILSRLAQAFPVALLALSAVRCRPGRVPLRIMLLAVGASGCLLLIASAPVIAADRMVGSIAPWVLEQRSQIFLSSFLTLEVGVLAWLSRAELAARLPAVLLLSALASAFMMSRASLPVWVHLRFLWTLQFPWRYAGLLSLFSVGLVGYALGDPWLGPHWSLRAAAAATCAFVWLVIAAGDGLAWEIRGKFAGALPPDPEPVFDVALSTYLKSDSALSLAGFGSDAGRPIFIGGSGAGTLLSVSSRHARLEATCPRPCTVVLRQVYFPGWRAQDATGVAIALRPSDKGLVELALPAGAHRVELTLPSGPGEIVGAIVSALALCVLAFLFLFRRENQIKVGR